MGQYDQRNATTRPPHPENAGKLLWRKRHPAAASRATAAMFADRDARAAISRLPTRAVFVATGLRIAVFRPAETVCSATMLPSGTTASRSMTDPRTSQPAPTLQPFHRTLSTITLSSPTRAPLVEDGRPNHHGPPGQIRTLRDSDRAVNPRLRDRCPRRRSPAPAVCSTARRERTRRRRLAHFRDTGIPHGGTPPGRGNSLRPGAIPRA